MGKNLLRVIVLVVIVVLVSMSLFTVHEREKAMVLELGRIVSSDYAPGIHGKMFYQSVRKFDARIQTLDAPPELFLTSEKKNVLVDSFVKFRIRDAEAFYKSTGGGNMVRAGQRLGEVIKKGLKDQFGKRTIQEVISGERAEVMDILTRTTSEAASEFGIDIVDVRIKRIDLPSDVSSSVYQRMQAERQRVAKDFRSRGAEEAKRIRAKAQREREIILAEAERDAQKLRGEGDAVAADTYAKAYSQDQEFYALYRSLNAYRATFKDKGDVILLEPDSEFFRFFNDPSGKR